MASVWIRRLTVSVLLLICATGLPMPRPLMTDFLPQPNLAYCIVAAWIVRRPECVPLSIVAITALLEETLLLTPPGLWSAAMVLSALFLRDSGAMIKRTTFVLEWGLVSITFLVASVVCALLKLALFIPSASLQLMSLDVMATVAAYPLVVLVSNQLFGVRHMTATESRLLEPIAR